MADTDRIIEERKQRWRDLYDLSRPPGYVFIIRYGPDNLEEPLPHPDKKQPRIEWAWQTYERSLARLDWLDDDSIPYLFVSSGTEIFAEAFGCEVYRPDDTMPSARPLIHHASEVARLNVPDIGSTPLAMLFEIGDELRRRAGDGAVLRIADIQSPMGISALIWEKSSFYPALIESPEAVKELAAKVKQLLVAFLDEWFARYGREFIAHYPDYYMPQGVTLSEDEVGSVSPEAFREFFLPDLIELSDRYGGIGVHCCAHARHQWENFREIPNLRVLNLVQPEDELRAAYPYFAPDVAQMHTVGSESSPWPSPEQYPDHPRLVLEAVVETKEQAVALSEKLRKVA